MIDTKDVEIYIEIQGLYDGWSVAKMKDGSLVNRWSKDDYRHERTQSWIDAQADTGAGA